MKLVQQKEGDRKISPKKMFLLIIPGTIIVLICAFSQQTKDQSYMLSRKITRFIADIIGLPQNDANDSFRFIYTLELWIRKTAHMVLFLSLGIGIYYAIPIFESQKEKVGRRVLLMCGISLVFAVIDEFHQMFIPGRTSTIWDVLIDMCGVLIFGVVQLRKLHKIKTAKEECKPDDR